LFSYAERKQRVFADSGKERKGSRRMLKKLKPLSLLLFLALPLMLAGCSTPEVLDPKGPVASQQSDLIILSIIFMLTIVAVVFVLLTIILVKYRERKDHDKYSPELHGSMLLETIWTIIPIIIVVILAIPTVRTIYNLEEAPEAKTAEAANEDPLVIEATSINWKWVFTYPEEDIETVDYLHIPIHRPVEFKLTSADNMAALWIPSLGGQKYAMSGMQTTLFLQADEAGEYDGRNANFTGEGFNEQRFVVYAEEEADYDQWVEEVQDSAPELTQYEYDNLLIPGVYEGTAEFNGTHLQWIDHSKDAEYTLEAWERLGYEPKNPHAKDKNQNILPEDEIPYYEQDNTVDYSDENMDHENMENEEHASHE
jgi:cytochrome aa3-600 menaquinol oxidase subunit II